MRRCANALKMARGRRQLTVLGKLVVLRRESMPEGHIIAERKVNVHPVTLG